MTLEFQSLALLGGLSLLMAAGIEIAPAMGIVAGLGMVFLCISPWTILPGLRSM